MNDELKEIMELIDTGRTNEARNRLAQIIIDNQVYESASAPHKHHRTGLNLPATDTGD
jgi:hypothetical protein